MNEELIKLIGIFLISMFKFIAGPVLGTAAGYPFWKILLITTLAMMTSVTIFTFLGSQIKELLNLKVKTRKPIFSKRFFR